MGYRIIRKPSKSYIVRSGANYYAQDDLTLQNSLGTTTQDYYGALVNTVYGLIYVGNDTYLVATSDLEMVSNVSDYNQIQSMDDITPVRYGYGNQNGYVIGIGNELNGTYANGVFTLGTGLAVVQGVEVEIDANGITTTIDTANENRYYKIFLEVNFNRAINLYEANLVSYYSTVSYDEIQAPTSGEVRNNQPVYMELYHFQIQSGTISDLEKTVQAIKYTEDVVVKNAIEAQFASNDHTKGTIEQRLTNLGFKSDTTVQFDSSVQNLLGSNSHVYFYRLGNFVIIELFLSVSNSDKAISLLSNAEKVICRIPENFKPNRNSSLGSSISNISAGISCRVLVGTSVQQVNVDLSGKIDILWSNNVPLLRLRGEVFNTSTLQPIGLYTKPNNAINNYPVFIGYEAAPL